MNDVSSSARVDPILVEIIRNGLVAATEEMKTNLMRTAYNMIIYEALDFTVGLFDAQGNTVSIGIGLPMFIRGMSNTVKAKLAHYGASALQEGDVLLTNDAYTTGSHLNHMTFSVPIFWSGELVAFASCMAHWQDIGGAIGGMTSDIFAEGLQMPIVKLVRAGQMNEELLAVIRMNVRVPERAMGDLRAQIGAVKTGEKRFIELLEKYGKDAVLASIATIMDQSEAAARAAVRAIPDGTYEASSFMDDDGVTVGQRIPIKVKVIVAGDRMTVDLSAVSPQVRGFYNSGETAGHSCAQVAFKCLTAPHDLPINDGCFRAVAVILPPGKVVSAVKPAPMRFWMTFPMTVVDTIFKALAPAIPERVIAGHHADLCVTKISGFHPRDGRLFMYTGGLIGGGWGAKHGEDGENATIAINDGDTHNGPSEQVEAKYPLLVESYRLREDSGGPGRWRGGLGVEQVVRALGDIGFDAQFERVNCPPWGLEGGLSASGNQVRIQRGAAAITDFPNGKVLGQYLRAGDRFVLRSGGGGGYGGPLERDPAQIGADVREGYVTLHAARHFYGVVIDPMSLTVDPRATDALRAAMRARGLPKDAPLPQARPRGALFGAATSAPSAETAAPYAQEARTMREAIVAAGLFCDSCCA
jgi:N-methylhydantoinase B